MTREVGLAVCEAFEEADKVILFGLHRRNPTAVRHRCPQRSDSENEYSTVTAKTSTAL